MSKIILLSAAFLLVGWAQIGKAESKLEEIVVVEEEVVAETTTKFSSSGCPLLTGVYSCKSSEFETTEGISVSQRTTQEGHDEYTIINSDGVGYSIRTDGKLRTLTQDGTPVGEEMAYCTDKKLYLTTHSRESEDTFDHYMVLVPLTGDSFVMRNYIVPLEDDAADSHEAMYIELFCTRK